jgi:phage baseplate assembly protein W
MPQKNLVIKPQNIKSQATVKNSQFYKGFSTLDDTSASVRLFDFDLVKQDLLNQFNTRRGERLMNPLFGTVIWDLLYEPLTPAVKQQIAEDIDRIIANDVRIVPLSVKVIEEQYGFRIDLVLQYAGTDKTDQLILAFDRKVGLRV